MGEILDIAVALEIERKKGSANLHSFGLLLEIWMQMCIALISNTLALNTINTTARATISRIVLSGAGGCIKAYLI